MTTVALVCGPARGTSVAAMVIGVFLAVTLPAYAQLQLAQIAGVVTGPDGAVVGGATVTLLDRVGSPVRSVTSAADGGFRFAEVPPGSYAIHADAAPFHAQVRDVQVGAGLPVNVSLRMSAVVAEQLLVRAPASAEPGSTSTRLTLGSDTLRHNPARVRSRGLQDVLATVPGWSSEDNGLLHVRGVDEGVLYVIDGVPAYERFDGLFGVAPDTMSIESVTISTGYIPPEFGLKSGAVVEVRSAGAVTDRWVGSVEGGLASESAADGAAVASGPMSNAARLMFNAGGHRSARFLDPTHPDNLHNSGVSLTTGGELGWQLTPSATLRAVVGASFASFDVPHDDLQEAAGQDQQQRVSGSWQTVSWERVLSGRTVATIAGYHRTARADLDGSSGDTPLTARADRRVRRVGMLASTTHNHGAHVFKLGAEAATLRLRESFSFAVTDPESEAAAEFTPQVTAFTLANPFGFSDAAAPTLFSLYAQDSIRATDQVTVDVGIRADWSRMLASASQVSPRAGVAYRIDRTKTIARASFGRFFQPPQAENLLLSSSVEARELSPLASDESGGGAELLPERQTAVEAGIEQAVGLLRLDVAYWHRWVWNAADPNVFLGTTIIFPNTVAKGWASGIDARLDLPRHRGWSAFVSYSNSRVEQAGPITGGLFLEDDVAELAEGQRFTPDHDQRNVGAAGASFVFRQLVAGMNIRYESGTPLQVDEDELEELAERPGSELVDFERGRVKPRRSVDFMLSHRLLRQDRADVTVRLSVLNATASRWAYNFGNPFSGTHFGPGRTLQLGVRATFR